MKIKGFLLVAAAVLAAACSVDNYSRELGPAKEPSFKSLEDDGLEISGYVTYRGGHANIDLWDALESRTTRRGTDLVLDSKLVIIPCSLLSTGAETEVDKLVEEAFRRGVIIAITAPDYNTIRTWCSRRNFVFPAEEVVSADNDLMLCAFSSLGWLYDIDNPPAEADFSVDSFKAWLNPFVSWVNAHIAGEAAPEPYEIGSAAAVDIERNVPCQRYDHTFFVSLENEGLSALSQLTLRFRSYPLSTWPLAGEDSRDYFLCKTSVSIDNSPLYGGVSTTEVLNGVNSKHSSFIFKSLKLNCEYFGGVDSFVKGPAPADAQAGSSFDSGFDWSLNGGYTVGPASLQKSSSLTTYDPIEFKGAGSMKVWEDLDVRNSSDNGVVNFAYEVPSALLGYMHRYEIVESQAEICRNGRDDLDAVWVWEAPSFNRDGSEGASPELSRVMNLSVETRYLSMWFNSVSVGNGNWNSHTGNLTSSGKCSIILLNPGRVVTGQLQFTNDFSDGASVSHIRIWEDGKDSGSLAPDYDFSNRVLAPGDRLFENLEAGTYTMHFNWNKPDSDEMLAYGGSITVTAAGACVVSTADFTLL